MKKILIPIIFVIVLSCDEGLPPRTDPSDLFQITISSGYIYNHHENLFVFKITIINKYDEAIESPLKTNGSIKIKWVVDDIDKIPPINIERNAVINNSHLFHAKNYDVNTNKLIILPGDSIAFQYKWDLKTDDSTFLPYVIHFGEGFRYDDYLYRVGNAPFPCNALPNVPRKVFRPQRFIVSTELQVFDKLSKFISEKFVAEECYINFFVANQSCISITNGNSCQLYSLLQQ